MACQPGVSGATLRTPISNAIFSCSMMLAVNKRHFPSCCKLPRQTDASTNRTSGCLLAALCQSKAYQMPASCPESVRQTVFVANPSRRDSLRPSSDRENDFIAHFKLDVIWLLHAVGAQLSSFIVVYIFCPLYLKLAAENAGALSDALALFEKP
jgi:hypothetical protein